MSYQDSLTHWGWVKHICVSKLTIIGSDNGLSPGGRQAIIWTNSGILLIGPLGTNFSEILIKIQRFSFKKMHLKMSSGKWRPFCLDLNVLITKAHITKHFIIHTSWIYNSIAIYSTEIGSIDWCVGRRQVPAVLLLVVNHRLLSIYQDEQLPTQVYHNWYQIPVISSEYIPGISNIPIYIILMG